MSSLSSNTDQEEDFDQILYVLIPIGIIITHYASWKFWQNNHEAYLKVGMLVWYGLACWLTVIYLAFDAADWNFADNFFTFFYNCAAQLIAFTGICDCVQFMYCLTHQKTYSETNFKFIKLYAFCSTFTFLIFLVVFFMELPLHFYRTISLILIFAEMGSYLQVLRIGWEKFNMSSIIYFVVTTLSRTGKAGGVIARMALANQEIGQKGDQVGFIHYMSVMFAIGVVVFFVDEIDLFIDAEHELTIRGRGKSSTVEVTSHQSISE